MLEILIIGLIVSGVVFFLLWRKKSSAPPGDKPVTFVCPHCGEKDCHCERRE